MEFIFLSNFIDDRKKIKLIIDNSMSMSSQIENLNKLEIAKNLAYDYIKSNTENTELIVGNTSLGDFANQEILFDQINLIDFDDISFSLEKIKNLNDTSKFNYIIITDLQFNATSLSNFDSEEKVTIIPITDNNKSNIFIDSCWLKNYDYNSDFFEIFVKLSNGGDLKIDNFSAFLFSDNKQITQSIFNLKPQEDTTITMKFPAEKFNSKLYLLINDDSYQFDNQLFFSVDNVEKSKVLQITNKKSNFENLSNSTFEFIDFTFQNTYNSLENIFGFDAVIINEYFDLEKKSIEILSQYVKKGGNLFISLNKKFNNEALLSHFDIYTTNWSNQNLNVNKINYEHPICNQIFEEEIYNNMKIFNSSGYYKLSSKSNYNEILSLENSDPFLLSNKYFDGNIFIMTSPFSRNTFKNSPLFAPIFFNILNMNNISEKLYEYIKKEYYIINEKNKLIAESISNGNDEVKLKSKKEFGKLIIIPTDKLTKHDNYLVKYNDNTTQNLSLNYSRDESKINSISVNDLNKFIVDNKMKNIRVLDAKNKNQIKFKNKIKEYWKFCLILTLLFFLFEILFVRRIENEYTY
ncbi:hypothetical protein OBB01_04390 [Bacteroidota bacterium]|nr:hypothetical protein [Bacteroidota bacterium]